MKRICTRLSRKSKASQEGEKPKEIAHAAIPKFENWSQKLAVILGRSVNVIPCVTEKEPCKLFSVYSEKDVALDTYVSSNGDIKVQKTILQSQVDIELRQQRSMFTMPIGYIESPYDDCYSSSEDAMFSEYESELRGIRDTSSSMLNLRYPIGEESVTSGRTDEVVTDSTSLLNFVNNVDLNDIMLMEDASQPKVKDQQLNSGDQSVDKDTDPERTLGSKQVQAFCKDATASTLKLQQKKLSRVHRKLTKSFPPSLFGFLKRKSRKVNPNN